MKNVMSVVMLVAFSGLAAGQARADTPAKPAEAPKPAERKPPTELVEMAKTAGTWTCKGSGMDQASMKMTEMNGTMKLKATLGGWWIHGAFEATGNHKLQLETYTTYDTGSKKWKRLMVDNSGSWTRGESSGAKNGKTDWEMVSYTPMGEGKFRDHEENVAGGVKMWGEVSPDNGTTWIKVYEMTCKK